MSEDLKPCPFCGGDEVDFQRYESRRWTVGCHATDCICEGPHRATMREAAEAWNTRTPPRVKALEWEERRQHKLVAGHYEVACNTTPTDPDAIWRVKYHGKVICKKIKGVHRATAWANDHNTRRVLACLEGHNDA